MTALQLLPPRQRAVLILRDVLGFRAAEVAHMLESSEESVTSALKRARATSQRRIPPAGQQEPPPAPGSAVEQEAVEEFTHAYRDGDLNGVVALLTEDVLVAMPPLPLEYQGRELAVRFLAVTAFREGRTFRLVRPGQRPASVRPLPPGSPGRCPARERADRAHPRGQPDLRHYAFRQRRGAPLRAPARPAGLTRLAAAVLNLVAGGRSRSAGERHVTFVQVTSCRAAPSYRCRHRQDEGAPP